YGHKGFYGPRRQAVHVLCGTAALAGALPASADIFRDESRRIARDIARCNRLHGESLEARHIDFEMERVKGIEPSYAAWEAAVLALNYTRYRIDCSSRISLMIQVKVNGAAQRFDAPLNISALLQELAMAGKKVAVERNGEIVPKSAHANTVIADGDELE